MLPTARGFWFPPTVVLADSVDQRIWREEVFGPVVAVMPFRDEAEAVQLANDSEFGLSGSIYTGDVGRALRVSRGVEAGNLSVNTHSSVRYWTPFGGFKQSGLGRELGPDAPHSFTDVKNVFISDEGKEATMTGRLEGKTAVVTGGCSGIGLATVRRFVEEGAKVVIGDLDDSRGPGIADEVGGTYLHTNVTDKEQVDALFARRSRRTGRSTSRSTTPASRRRRTTRS